jgi:hypothetical protein
MQSQNNFIDKSKITMNISVVAGTVIEDPVIKDSVIEDPVIDTVQPDFESKTKKINFIEKTKITMNISRVTDPVNNTAQSNFESKIKKVNFIEQSSDSEDEIEIEIEDAHVYKIPLEHFGTFELELKKVQISNEKKTINIMIDNSGSMDQKCSDGNTQLEQVVFVTDKVLRFIEENCPEGNISVSVKTFSTRVRTIFEATPVLSSNINELIAKLKKIYSEEQTNIGIALREMHTTGPEQYNIFLSDGDANYGISDPLELTECVDKNAINTFIGFGIDHNPEIFDALSNTKNSSYYFIEAIEKSRNAYAEILERILYKCLESVTIEITGGKLYNYKTNSLESELYVGNMSGSMKKTFHLYSETPEEVEIIVKSNGIVQKVVNFEGNRKNLEIAFYRQKTLELLYKTTNSKKYDKYRLKNELNSVMNEIKAYMKANNILDNLQLKYLCNDIAVVYQTLGTRDAFMYSCSRQASNGDQRMHNVVVDKNTIQRASRSSNIQRGSMPSNIQRGSMPSDIQRGSMPSDIQRAPRSSNYHDNDDIDNFCITDDSPFTSENVNTILKSFTPLKN